jgi:hypothetical protein
MIPDIRWFSKKREASKWLKHQEGQAYVITEGPQIGLFEEIKDFKKAIKNVERDSIKYFVFRDRDQAHLFWNHKGRLSHKKPKEVKVESESESDDIPSGRSETEESHEESDGDRSVKSRKKTPKSKRKSSTRKSVSSVGTSGSVIGRDKVSDGDGDGTSIVSGRTHAPVGKIVDRGSDDSTDKFISSEPYNVFRLPQTKSYPDVCKWIRSHHPDWEDQISEQVRSEITIWFKEYKTQMTDRQLVTIANELPYLPWFFIEKNKGNKDMAQGVELEPGFLDKIDMGNLVQSMDLYMTQSNCSPKHMYLQCRQGTLFPKEIKEIIRDDLRSGINGILYESDTKSGEINMVFWNVMLHKFLMKLTGMVGMTNVAVVLQNKLMLMVNKGKTLTDIKKGNADIFSIWQKYQRHIRLHQLARIMYWLL